MAANQYVQETVQEIMRRYQAAYGKELQGCCLVIADEILQRCGGVIVAGYIEYGAGNQRSHWWVERGGVVIDPLCELMFAPEDNPKRVEVHRDRATFEKLLPQYERWRV